MTDLRKIRSVYKPHARVTLQTILPSRTKQEFKDECNINTIMTKYMKTGLLDHVATYQGRYEDVSTGVDLQEAYAIQERAETAFESLPAEMRKRFENDPVQFLNFVLDPENLKEVQEMGLGLIEPPDPLPVPPDTPPAAIPEPVIPVDDAGGGP